MLPPRQRKNFGALIDSSVLSCIHLSVISKFWCSNVVIVKNSSYAGVEDKVRNKVVAGVGG